jgi:hypothetical protein
MSPSDDWRPATLLVARGGDLLGRDREEAHAVLIAVHGQIGSRSGYPPTSTPPGGPAARPARRHSTPRRSIAGFEHDAPGAGAGVEIEPERTPVLAAVGRDADSEAAAMPAGLVFVCGRPMRSIAGLRYGLRITCMKFPFAETLATLMTVPVCGLAQRVRVAGSWAV